MLLALTQWLGQFESAFFVFNFLTLRGIVSLLTSLGLSLMLGPIFINWLTRKQYGQVIRQYGVESHKKKAGTPTMGGALIIFVVVLTTILWSDLSNSYVYVCVFATLGFGILGFVDDWSKITKKNPEGMSVSTKFFWQSIMAAAIAVFLFIRAESSAEVDLYLPFFKDLVIPIGIGFIAVSWLCIVGSSNAVNITDGLDGLAIVPVMLIASALGIFAYVSGNTITSEYLLIPYIHGVGEVAIFCASIAGAALGFLWFNAYPAQVFMGDVGSLSLGAALAVVAIIVRQEIVFFIMSGIFVIEALSVIVQVASYKLTGKRVFRMAPIHHHFELKGWPEPKVIVRLWIVTIILVAVGLATLKLR